MRLRKTWIIVMIITAALVGVGLRLVAQESTPTFDVQVQRDVLFKHAEAEETGPLFYEHMTPGEPADFTFQFVSSEMSFGDGTVKGAPFSADTATEVIQTLSDGNRIIRKSSGKLYRDGEGRTRREQTLGPLGFWVPAEEPQQLVFINDPVAGGNYVLEMKDKIARKLPSHLSGGMGTIAAAGHVGAGKGVSVMTETKAHIIMPFAGETKTEALGKQQIEGVEAEGTRTTTTIPAGKIGNELPIQIVSERWFSPDLKIVVRSEHNDPQFGKTLYQLTNINRDEPAHSVFEVPPDYTVKDEPKVFIKKIERRNPGDSN
jgi:hypothetical protein